MHALRQPILTSSSLTGAQEHQEEEDQSFDVGDRQEGKDLTLKPIKDAEALELERTRLLNLTLVSSLLEELAVRYREEESKMKRGIHLSRNVVDASDDAEQVKEEDHELAVLLGLEEPRKKKKLVEAIRKKDERLRKFALHIRLPDGDYFTNAVEMTDEMIEELDTGELRDRC